MKSLSILSANLRCDNPFDGINAWSLRKEWQVENLKKANADIIGFQECMAHMRDYLEQEMPEYFFLGTGRDPNMRGEGMAVAYRKERFYPLWMKTFWLSLTPNVPGSSYGLGQSACPRCVTAVQLDEKVTGDTILFYNTHTDHRGAVPRLLAAVQIRQQMAYDIPACPAVPLAAFATGDFNAYPGEDWYEAMTSKDGFQDASPNLGMTYHGWGDPQFEKEPQIDFVFAKAIGATGLSWKATKIGAVTPEGQYTSDHWWVLSEISIEGGK
ncbi:MAG: endonuclease/exonuclease/phosphatase family protein [Oscillospiraceae bacterium]|jgi:endonuclease/exonuclease/phosphatase family metal-dependent hydrolase|nr:endonuclease/exonuclease/phosphatase family protein [Oscillospiraceae bacterium]